MTFIHPLVALFQGNNSGWFLEGRETLIGPACVMVKGAGQTANVGMGRRFPLGTTSPQMYQIRMRAYSGQWQNAVDPYLDWMQNTVGFVPVDQKSPVWVKRIKNQAYISIGDFQGLDMLAARVDPAKTFVGRQAEYRYYAFDIGYPDYRVSPTARQWFTYARQLGFHVGAHFNTYCIDKVLFPNLVEQFKPGLLQIGTDASGDPIYDGVGQNVYCSPAYQPWRQYLIQQMADAVSAGVDVIYLDQSMAPCGKFVVDGVNGVEGVMLLEQEIRQAYPTVAIETEQFNPMASRHAAFALSQMTLGHPLSGYIFNRFIRVVPEGIMYSPSDTATMDAFDTWGFMLPGADARREESWVQIAKAFQDYNLVPDSRMPLGANQLFGYQGSSGVTAFFEKHTNERGLVIYQPGQDPRWVGKRYFGITSWPGPGVPTYWELGRLARDWLIYSGSTALGLDPQQTYYMDETLVLNQNRFHITAVPADFLPYSNAGRRIVSQEPGDDDTYFKISFSGHGQMSMYVPDSYDVYLDGQKVQVDRASDSAVVTVSASTSSPSVIRAVRRSEFELVGKFVYFPMQMPDQVLGWISGDDAGGYINHVAGVAVFIGKLPQTTNIRLRGEYGMRPDSTPDFIGGDGVIRINGTEVLRVPVGSQPWQMYPFDVDISAFAGQYVMMEMLCDGEPHGYAYAQWSSPEITADPTTVGTSPLGGAGPGNGWSQTSAITVTASSQHSLYPAQNLINGSGISTDGVLHGNTGLFLTGQMAESKANPHPGTAGGGHWVEFRFDKVYPLGEMWIWNENSKSPSYDWRIQGMKDVTIQYSATGGANPSEWKTIYQGEIPIAWSGSPDYRCLPSLKLDFRGAGARYVVITTADTPNHNRTGGAYSDAGLSEVRFYAYPGEAVTIAGAKQAGNGTSVVLAGATVAAKLRDAGGPIGFSVEETDRSSGIRIISNTPVNPGDNVTVRGAVATIGGELVIDATGGSVTINASGGPAPLPIGMNNLSSGGGAFFGQQGVIDDASTEKEAAGLCSVGLLVRIFGRVTARAAAGGWDGYFYVHDGSGLNDGSGNIGIRCRPFGAGAVPDSLPALGDYVAVTGIMGVNQIGGRNVRFLWTTGITLLD